MSVNNSVASRMDELIAMVQQDRDVKRREILDKANEEADRIVKNSHKNARLRVKEAVAEERRLFAEAENTAQARLETDERRKRLKESEALLQLGRAALREALMERWHNPEARKEWLAMVTEQAVEFLPDGEWEIVCSQGVEAQEIQDMQSRIEKERAIKSFETNDAGLVAGLKIGCNQAWVDGSITALLADSRAIDAQLLGLIAAVGKQS